MSGDISTADWKVFRDLRSIALERFCERVLGEVSRAASESGQTAHDRYGAVFEIVRTRDRELARMFDDFRRSTAVLQLALMHSLQLLTPEELTRFSAETQSAIRVLAGIE